MTNKLDNVRDFAKQHHENPYPCQRYGSLPYSAHLDAVVEVIERYLYYINEKYHLDVINSGYCHDLIEDTEVSCKMIEAFLNKNVAEIVYAVSNELGRNRKERNFKTYPKIWDNDLAIFVKLADRIANTTNSKNSKHRMYKVYKNEYPVFKYALDVRGLYPKMWKELDLLNEYKA